MRERVTWLVCLALAICLCASGIVTAAPSVEHWVAGISIRSGTAPDNAKGAGNDLLFQVADSVAMIPFHYQGGAKRNWRATVTLTVTSGSTVWFRPFGPTYDGDQLPFRLTPANADSANTWTSVGPIDSLWAWCPTGSAWVNGTAYRWGE